MFADVFFLEVPSFSMIFVNKPNTNENETDVFGETNVETLEADSAEFCRVMRGLTMSL